MHGARRLQQECVELMVYRHWTSVQVGRLKGLKSSTLRNWKLHFLLFGRTPFETRRLKKLSGQQISHRVVSNTVKQHLRHLVKNKPYLYLDEFRRELHRRCNVLLSPTTIWRVLVNELGWTLQIAHAAAKQRDEVARARHQAHLFSLTADPAQFVFIDETCKNSETSLRKRCWMPRNRPLPLSTYFNDSGSTTYTVLAAADINGFIVESCELVRRKRNAQDLDPEAGTIDTDRFVDWVEQKLVPVLGSYLLGQPRSIVVLDNASIHLDDRILDAVTQKGALLVYQSAYSPDLNPIETCFHQYKSHLKRHHADFPRQPFRAHVAALQSVSRADMCAYYRKIGCIRNVPDQEMNEVRREEEEACFAAAAAAVHVQMMQTMEDDD